MYWYCSLYVLVLWVLLVYWYQPPNVSVPICYWYCIGTAVHMYWYCGYCWYTGTSHSMSLCLYVTGTSHSMSLCLYVTGTAVYMYWYCGYCWYMSTSNSMSPCLYVTGTTLVLLFICTGTVGTSDSMSLCMNGCVSLCRSDCVSLCMSGCVSLCMSGYLVVCLCGCGLSPYHL